jgi:uncharacterized iron-regulated membrane protein
VKALLMLLIVLAGVWLWRKRQASLTELKRQPPPVLDMVPCSFCAVHVPGAEAVPGAKGCYCSLDHLHQAEP